MTLKIIANLLKVITIAFFLSNCTSLNAQITCTANAPPQVAVGQAFTFTFSLNQRAQQISSYQFPGFDILSGPNQSSQDNVQIVNGQVTQSRSIAYSFTLRASAEGNYIVPAAIFVVDGNSVKSNSVPIKVVAAQQAGTHQSAQQQTQRNQNQPQNQPFDKNDVYIRASLSKSNPYQGEQVIVTHKLYVGQSVNGGYRVNNITIPSQSGLWSYTLGDPDAENPGKPEIINGKKFTVHEIRRTAVFPQKNGEITITPMQLEFLAGVITQQSSGDPFFDRFFGGRQNSQNYEFTVKSNAALLNVKSLPQNNKPDFFSDLVGTFSLSSHLSRKQLKSDDATNLTITIQGIGNLQHIDALALNFPADFDVTEPKISDNINTKGGSVNGSRTFEYVIIPRNEGTFTIPSTDFTYFDLLSNSYKALSTPNFELQVEKGDGQLSVSTSSTQKDIKILGNDIRFIRASNIRLRSVSFAFFGSTTYFASVALPLLILVIIILLWRKHIEKNRDLELVRNRKAKKVAEKNLKLAHKLMLAEKKDDFYIEISRALWGYLSAKYHIPTSQLSIETVEKRLYEKKVSLVAISEFINTLTDCEFARFAPGDINKQMNEMYFNASDFIQKNETSSK